MRPNIFAGQTSFRTALRTAWQDRYPIHDVPYSGALVSNPWPPRSGNHLAQQQHDPFHVPVSQHAAYPYPPRQEQQKHRQDGGELHTNTLFVTGMRSTTLTTTGGHSGVGDTLPDAGIPSPSCMPKGAWNLVKDIAKGVADLIFGR